jgi:hypothetical protein
VNARHLSVAQSATVKPHVIDGVLDTSVKGFAAVASSLGIRPGRYAVGKYVVKSGPNVGKKSLTLTPADEATDYAGRLAQAERAVAQWSDQAYIARRRAAAQERLDAVRAERPAQGKGKGKGKGKRA